MRDAHDDIALDLIKAYNSRADKRDALTRAQEADARSERELADAVSAAVVAGVTGLFRWDGEYYAINDGSGPNVTEVDVGDLGEPKRYQGKA